MRLLLLLAFAGCGSLPDRITVRGPDRTPLAIVNLEHAEIVLTPQGFALLAAPRRHR